jgi:hypothetical protein
VLPVILPQRHATKRQEDTPKYAFMKTLPCEADSRHWRSKRFDGPDVVRDIRLVRQHVDYFRMAPDAKRGDHFLQAALPLPIRGPRGILASLTSKRILTYNQQENA